MKKIIIIVLLGFICACSSRVKRVGLTGEDAFNNPYISFNAPQQAWYVLDNKEWILPYQGTKSEDASKQRQSLHNKDYATFNIQIRTAPKSSPKLYFDKNADYDDIGEKSINSERNKKINKRQGITYDNYWTSYINGLKCYGSVFLRGIGGSYAPSGYKQYNIRCGYYHKTEAEYDGRRTIGIEYSATFSNNASDEQKLQKLQALKEAVKQIVNTIKIKDMDIDRMQAEGLLHPGKKFESTQW